MCKRVTTVDFCSKTMELCVDSHTNCRENVKYCEECDFYKAMLVSTSNYSLDKK